MNLLASVTEIDQNIPIEGVGDIFSYGLQMMLIGMGTVFSVLVIIWLSLIGFKYLFANLGNASKANSVAKESVTVAPTYTPPAPQDAELVAVIAAAIAAAESETNGAKFRVVSFRRK